MAVFVDWADWCLESTKSVAKNQCETQEAASSNDSKQVGKSWAEYKNQTRPIPQALKFVL